MLRRRTVVSLLAAAAVAPAGALASGCGAEEAVGVDVAKAATATAKKGTARYEMTIAGSGFGLPQKVDVKATGVTALDGARLTMTMDLGPLVAGFGLPARAGKIDLRVDGKDVYVKVPPLPGIKVPGGKEWVGVDAARIAEAAGLDADGLGALLNADPAAQLRALKAAKDLDEVGEENIDGARTTHFKGSYSITDLIDALPAAEGAKVRASIEKLEKLTGDGTLDQPTPAEFWVDEDDVVRRMRTSTTTPSQPGVPGGRFAIDMRLTDFGAALDVARPASVFDATEALGGLLQRGAAAGLTPG